MHALFKASLLLSFIWASSLVFSSPPRLLGPTGFVGPQGLKIDHKPWLWPFWGAKPAPGGSDLEASRGETQPALLVGEPLGRVFHHAPPGLSGRLLEHSLAQAEWPGLKLDLIRRVLFPSQ